MTDDTVRLVGQIAASARCVLAVYDLLVNLRSPGGSKRIRQVALWAAAFMIVTFI